MSLRKYKRQVKRTGQGLTVVTSQPKPGYMDRYLKDIVRANSGDMAMCMYYMFGIQLHRLFGFGANRLARLYDEVDREMKGWGDRKFDRADLERQLYEETGIDYRG